MEPILRFLGSFIAGDSGLKFEEYDARVRDDDEDGWQPVQSGTKMEDSGYHFFKYVLRPSEFLNARSDEKWVKLQARRGRHGGILLL